MTREQWREIYYQKQTLLYEERCDTEIFFSDIKVTSYSNTGKFKSRKKANVLIRNCFWLVVTDINLSGISKEDLFFSQWVSVNRQLVALVLSLSGQGLWDFLYISLMVPRRLLELQPSHSFLQQQERNKAGHQIALEVLSNSFCLYFIDYSCLWWSLDIKSPLSQVWVSREEWENISKMSQKPCSHQI